MNFVKLGKIILFVKLFLLNNVLLFAQVWNPEMDGPPEEAMGDSSFVEILWTFALGILIIGFFIWTNEKWGIMPLFIILNAGLFLGALSMCGII